MTSAPERGLRSGHRLSWLAAANALQDRGHEVLLIAARCAAWADAKMPPRCALREADPADPASIPPSDAVIATSWTLVEAARAAGQGRVLHLCTEDSGILAATGGLADAAAARAAFCAEDVVQIAGSPRIQAALLREFDLEAGLVNRGVPSELLAPATPRGASRRPVRVGLVGDGAHSTDNLNVGLEACALAQRAGLDLQVVRIAAGPAQSTGIDTGANTEWHADLDGDAVVDLLHSLDLYVGTATGDCDAALLEFLAAGVPCVLSDTDCHRQFGNAQFGLYADATSSAQIAEAVVVAAQHASLRAELSGNALEVAKEHSTARFADALAAVLAELAPAPSPGDATPLTPPASALSDADPADTLALNGWITAARELLDAAGDMAEFESRAARLVGLLGAEVAHQRGLRRYAAGDAQGAAQAFEEALPHTSKPAEVRNDLGVARFGTGDVSGACAEFERALAMDPNHADARVNLTETAALRDPQGAVPSRV